MREILRQYAAGYAKSEEQLTLMEDDQSSIHYPEVYLFIGDKTASAIEPIMEIHDRKWDNSASVIYLHVGTDQDGGGSRKAPNPPVAFTVIIFIYRSQTAHPSPYARNYTRDSIGTRITWPG